MEKKVRAVLEQHCFKCHSHQAGKSKGALILDSREAMLKGGETAPAIVPGHPEKSLLIQRIKSADAHKVSVRPPPLAIEHHSA